MLVAFVVAVISYSTTSAAAVKQVSTGPETACAVVDGKVKCWGEGGSGQLGNRSTSSSSTPVDVYAVKDPAPIRPNPCGGWFQPSCTPIEQPSSPLGGKTVSKVSVGANHACAIASAKLYCWGDNSKGQLGNRTNDRSTMPVIVDVQEQDVTPEPVRPNPCGGWFQPSCTPVAQPTKPKSALSGKEIVDVSAGEDFTCALASDGAVACWGEGDNGRLGTNATTDVNYPKAIYTADGSALAGKKGIRLAKTSDATMCVVAVEASSTQAAAGQSYCWGNGIDGGQALPANTSSVTVCNKNSPTSMPSAASKTTIFDSSKPVAVPGAVIASIDNDTYASGLGADGKAYYWGQYGYREDTTYANVTTCKVNPCTGKVTIERKSQIDVVLAANGSPPSGSGGLNNNKKNNTTGQGFNGKPGMANYTRYSGNDNSNNQTCMDRTHYAFIKNITNTTVGKKVATTPPTWPQSQAGIKLASGNVFNGLYCAVAASGPQCDAHGTDTMAGQTGSAYTQQCTINYANGLFGRYETGRTCVPHPSGPQTVVTSGWLAGKQISQLSMGKTGYTCAVASGAVGCWGVNNRGQLGTGDTSNKNVPTEVRL